MASSTNKTDHIPMLIFCVCFGCIVCVFFFFLRLIFEHFCATLAGIFRATQERSGYSSLFLLLLLLGFAHHTWTFDAYTQCTHTHTRTLFMIHSGEMLFKLRAVSSPSRQECEKERQDPREEEEKDGKSTFKRRNIYFVWCLLIIIA